jgi:hypothetical protein
MGRVAQAVGAIFVVAGAADGGGDGGATGSGSAAGGGGESLGCRAAQCAGGGTIEKCF